MEVHKAKALIVYTIPNNNNLRCADDEADIEMAEGLGNGMRNSCSSQFFSITVRYVLYVRTIKLGF